MAKATTPTFSKQTLEFIEKATRQKNPNWLEKNREDYEKFLLFPLKHLATQLKSKLAPLAPGYNFPQKGLGRLKRSANSALEYGALYRDWVAYSAAKPRVSRFDHNPNLYFLIQPGEPDGDEILIAGGLYMPSSRQMRKIREAIAEDFTPFEELFQSKEFEAHFKGGFSKEKIAKRPPRGFDPNHPSIDLLKLQAFFVWKPYTKKQFYSRDFSDIVALDCAQILRLNELLESVLEGRQIVSTPKKLRTGNLTSRLEGLEAPRRKMDF